MLGAFAVVADKPLLPTARPCLGTMLPQPAPPPPHAPLPPPPPPAAPTSPPPGPARFICIECSFPVSSLYTAYSSADDHSLGRGVRLTQCPRCKRFADKYVEHDKVVLFIDMVLIKPQVSANPNLPCGGGPGGARRANEEGLPPPAVQPPRPRRRPV